MVHRSSDPTSVTEIGTRLALTRKALGLTQVMMARLMGSVGAGQAWENYEAGRRRISIDHAMALTQSCGYEMLPPVSCGWPVVINLHSLWILG